MVVQDQTAPILGGRSKWSGTGLASQMLGKR
jgi:hypothetical protein